MVLKVDLQCDRCRKEVKKCGFFARNATSGIPKVHVSRPNVFRSRSRRVMKTVGRKFVALGVEVVAAKAARVTGGSAGIVPLAPAWLHVKAAVAPLVADAAVAAATGPGHRAKGAAACRVVGAVVVDTDTTIAGVVVKGVAAIVAAGATAVAAATVAIPAICRLRVSGAATSGAAELVAGHVVVEGVATVNRERQFGFANVDLRGLKAGEETNKFYLSFVICDILFGGIVWQLWLAQNFVIFDSLLESWGSVLDRSHQLQATVVATLKSIKGSDLIVGTYPGTTVV
ncbi:hypothetical protein GQ457_05G031330 [Hibiscus cannabinus]